MTRDIALQQRADDQACDWYERLRRDSTNLQQVAEFNAWLNADPGHAEAFKKVERLWLASKALQGTEEVARSRVLIEQLKAEAARKRATPEKRPLWPMAAAASIVLAAAIGWLAIFNPAPGNTRHYTGMGEQKTVTLADGSSITLNTQSMVDIRLTVDERKITLVRGQASFNVAKNESRPFVVAVASGRVTALGTAFDIYMASSRTIVTLMEGAVQVDWRQQKTPEGGAKPPALWHESVRLQPGQQVEMVEDKGLSAPVAANLSTVNSWLSGKLNYDETPLAHVIEQANRYAKPSLELGDATLAGIRVTGIFTAGENQALANALANLYDLELRPVGKHKIVLLPVKLPKGL